MAKELDKFSSIGHKELEGRIGSQTVMSMQGYWIDDSDFVVESYGIGNLPHNLFTKYNLQLRWKKR